MKPNTTYQVYAVAGSEKGIVGEITIASIKTTDEGSPEMDETKVDAATKTATITFDQAVKLGEGKVTAKYYKEFDD
jgi:hypothetical protein